MKMFNLILTFDSNLVFVVFINLNWEIGKEIKAMLPEPEEIVKKLRLFDNKL